MFLVGQVVSKDAVDALEEEVVGDRADDCEGKIGWRQSRSNSFVVEGSQGWKGGHTFRNSVVDLRGGHSRLLCQLIRQTEHGQDSETDVVLLVGERRVGRGGGRERSGEVGGCDDGRRVGRTFAARETEEDLKDVVHLAQMRLDEPPSLFGASSGRVRCPAVERVLDGRCLRRLDRCR